MDNPIKVDINKVMEHIHAEDDEQSMVQDIVNQAYAYLNKYLATQGMDVLLMSADEEDIAIYTRCILFLSSTWYSNSEGSEPASIAYNSKIAGGLKALLEVMRTPNL